MKTRLLAGAMALALIGCSEKSAEDSSSSNGADTSVAEASPSSATQSTDEASPGVGIGSAPGVAFDYAYAFRLDDNRIAKVQEDHAAACELLGVARCRIVDVRYKMVRENEVEAQTQFKLDPGIARKFGSDAIASVEKAEGVLADATVNGEDVGTQITDLQQRSMGATAEIARLEARLKQGGLDKSERSEIQQQIADLGKQLGGERDGRRTGEAKIASTTVVFNYVGTGGLPGIGHENPFSDAGAMLMRSGGTVLSLLLMVGAAVLPWGIALALLIFLWRSRPAVAARQRLRGKTEVSPPANPSAT